MSTCSSRPIVPLTRRRGTGSALLLWLLLGSITSNPRVQEADFFYLPVYMAHYIWPVRAWSDFPYFPGPNGEPSGQVGRRTHAAMRMQWNAFHWARTTLPFWNRSQGADHLVQFFHDEGGCYVPPEMWNATVLSHWGRLDLEHQSHGYDGDLYSCVCWQGRRRRSRKGLTERLLLLLGRENDFHPVSAPKGFRSYFGVQQPCFDPNKARGSLGAAVQPHSPS